MVHNAFQQGHAHGRMEARNGIDIKLAAGNGIDVKLRKLAAEKLTTEQEHNKMRFIHRAHIKEAAARHASIQEAAKSAQEAQTVYTEVMVTVTPTSSDTRVYATKTIANSVTNDAEASYLSAKSLANAANTNQASASTTTLSSSTRAVGGNVQKHTPLQFTRSSSSSATAKGAGAAVGTPISNTRGGDAIRGTPLSATRSSEAMISKKSDGMSGGAKAGLAFGIIIALALCGGLILLAWRRRKQNVDKEGAEKIIDEKRGTKDSFFGGMSAAAGRGPRESVQSQKSFTSTHSAVTAPRLSLRPITQFLPNIISGGNASDAPAMSEKPKSGWDRRPAGVEQNPFDDAAMISEKQARSTSASANPFEEGNGAVAAAGKSSSHSPQASLEGSEPATPKSAKFGTAAAVPITTAGAANGAETARGQNNVHRIQLDFKPSMEDEIELRSGQLVRMVHEYDDGWALCMRLDRSQQGVCPRTCLSKLPVKPRPQGSSPPAASNVAPARPAGPPPPQMRGRSALPQMTPGMVPRPLTPQGRERSATMGRDNSPAPPMRQRSMSAGGAGPRPSSPAAAMPTRKPVPGVAM